MLFNEYQTAVAEEGKTAVVSNENHQTTRAASAQPKGQDGASEQEEKIDRKEVEEDGSGMAAEHPEELVRPKPTEAAPTPGPTGESLTMLLSYQRRMAIVIKSLFEISQLWPVKRFPSR